MLSQKPEKLKTLPHGSNTEKTFIIADEDHTLGNALRYILDKNPKVQFSGYSKPHPSENKIHVRIQTYKEFSAVQVFKDSLRDLHGECAHVLNLFKKEVAEYKETKMEE